jgi:hypothetical protein
MYKALGSIPQDGKKFSLYIRISVPKAAVCPGNG